MTNAAVPSLNTSVNPRYDLEFPGIPCSSHDVDDLMMRILKQDDYEAFQLLFRKMYVPLCQFCVRFVRMNEVAEEVVSDVFYTIWKNRNRIEVTSSRSYLFTAVRNRAIDHLRKIKKSVWCNLDQAHHVATDCSNSQELMVEHELQVKIEKAVSTLPRQCRVIFELSRDQGLKYKEIATALNISIKTVETQMGRALKHLRKSLQPFASLS